MKNGFISVGAYTPAIAVADCHHNARAIVAAVKEAHEKGIKILSLPELCVTGYTCGELFLQRTLLEGALDAIDLICAHTADCDVLFAIGAPISHNGKLYNCAVVISHGEILGIVPKTNLPNYGEFAELRYFTPAPQENESIFLRGTEIPFGTKQLFTLSCLPSCTVAVELCEDLWVASSPSVAHTQAGATVILNLSCNNETVGKAQARRDMIRMHALKNLCAYLYAEGGEGESTTDCVFAGHNLICESSTLLCESKPFTVGMIQTEIDCDRIDYERRRRNSFATTAGDGYLVHEVSLQECETALTRKISTHPLYPEDETKLAARCEEILQIQAHGLAKRIRHTNAKCAVLGISGGLDSCLALLVAVRAIDLLSLDRKTILALTMPGFGTTARTKGNAQLLCEALEVSFDCVNIAASVRQHFADIGHDESVCDVTYENAQARERTQVLMDIANEKNGFVIGTGDLSELALGWATYNGDHMSMYGVNASIPKTLMRHIVRYYANTCENKALAKILFDILDTPVSPELLPAKDGEIAQCTEDLVGPYELHDFFLYYFLRYGYSPKKIYRLARYAFAGAYEDAIILKWLRTFCRRFFNQQFKRSCLPDGVKVGAISLSPRGGFPMPSDALSTLWLKELDE